MYVLVSVRVSECTCSESTCYFISSVIMYGYYVGGDQMTVSRVRGMRRIRSNSARGKDRLEGLYPMVEDWHAKVIFLEVCGQ